MRYILSIIAAASIILSFCTNTLIQAMIEQSNPIVKQAVPEAEAAKGLSTKPKPAVTLAGNWKLAFQDEFLGADTDLDANWDSAKWRPVPGASRKALDNQAKEYGAPPNLGEAFHVYSLLWTEKELVHYFDGKPIYRTKNDICHKPAPVWLSLAIMKWAGPVADALDGKSMDVDYVRVWQREQ